jgi:hypothetical protein
VPNSGSISLKVLWAAKIIKMDLNRIRGPMDAPYQNDSVRYLAYKGLDRLPSR